jgi:transmembrane sensor
MYEHSGLSYRYTLMENTAIQDFVIASLLGDADALQQAQLQEWLSASANNRSLYEDIQRIWDSPFGILNTGDGWEALKAQVQPRNYWWLKVAAVIVPLLLAAWFYHSPDWHTYVASGALKDSLLLPDGSLVYLAPGTVLNYNDTREVRLSNGAAFFKVVKNEQHTFTVKAGNATVKVLGTSFNILKTPAGTDVTVRDGKVSLESNKGIIILTEGEMGIVDQHTGDVSRRHSELAFNNQPLKVVLKELSAWYHVQLHTADSTMCRRNVTVRFREMPLAEALVILSETMDIRISRITDTSYILTDRK